MEKEFEQLNIEDGFVLRPIKAMRYLDYIAQQHVDKVLTDKEDCIGMTELFEDIVEMKRDIAIHDYEFVKLVQCDTCASKVDIVPMIEAQELKEAIEDLTEWVLNNCDTSETIPMIFSRNSSQAMLEKFIKERKEQ